MLVTKLISFLTRQLKNKVRIGGGVTHVNTSLQVQKLTFLFVKSSQYCNRKEPHPKFPYGSLVFKTPNKHYYKQILHRIF